MLRKHPIPALLAAIIFLLHLPVLLSPVNYLLTWFNTDDAFYYFVTARNVAAGDGFTFDGIARTNGFHPLWMFVLIPIFALPGKVLALRVLAGLLILLNLGSALLLFRLARRVLSPGVAFLVALAFSLLPIIHNETTKGGVEAGINVFFILLLLNAVGFRRTLAETDARNTRGVLILSGIASLTFLARLDNIFLAILVGGWLLLRSGFAPPSSHPSPPTMQGEKEQSPSPRAGRGWGGVRLALAYFLPLALVVLTYMAWNWIGFGTPTPVSGQVKRWWGTLPNSVYGFPPKRLSNYIGQFVTDDQSIGPWAILTGPFYRTAEGLVTLFGQEPTTGARRLALAGLGFAALGLLGWLGWRNRAWIWETVRGLGLIPLLGGCLFQIAYYKVGGSVAERTWYWVGEMLWVVLAGGVILQMIWQITEYAIRNTQYILRIAYCVVFVLSIWLIWPHLTRIPRIFSTASGVGYNGIEYNGEAFYLRRAHWLEANTESGAVIAMTGTGSSAYFTEGRRMFNLDGLINSYEYFRAMQNGTAHEYLADFGVDYVFGNAYIIQESDPYGDIFEGRLVAAARYVDGDRELVLWRFLP